MTEGFAAVPTWMIRSNEVSVYAISVYLSLSSRNGLDGIFPNQQTIAREARCSERKVRDALGELEKLGVVERIRRNNSFGRTTNAYVLLSAPRPSPVPAPDAATGEVPAPGDRGTGTSVQTSPYIEADKEEANKGLDFVHPSKPEYGALLDLLDSLIVGNGSKKPSRNKANVNAIRLLVERDNRSISDVERVIRWSQQDRFWKVNILSAAKLREKFDQLRLAAENAHDLPFTPGQQRGLSIVNEYREQEMQNAQISDR